MANRGTQNVISTLLWKSLTKETYIKLSPHVDTVSGTRILHDHELLVRLFYGPDIIDHDPSTTRYLIQDQNQESRVSFHNDASGVTEDKSLGLGFHLSVRWQVVPRESVPTQNHDVDAKVELAEPAFCLRETSTVRGVRLVSNVLNLRHANAVSLKLRVLAKAMEIVGDDPAVSTVDLVAAAKKYVAETHLALYSTEYG